MATEAAVEQVKTTIRRKHLEQLKQLPVAMSSVRVGFPTGPSYFSWMEQWSKKAKAQISAAIAAKATAGSTIDWNIALYAFMESAAMYLRDWPSVFKAAKAAQEGRDEEAMAFLIASDAEIQQIATMWSPTMHYVTICDLLKESPDSDPTLDGPVCGVFFSSSPYHPFIGIAFKGTHPESWSELLVDLHYAPVQASSGRLWGTHVSEGVFTTLFRPFSKLDGQVPYDYIKKTVLLEVLDLLHDPTGMPISLHVTGHSLGASYASLFYAELLRQYNNRPADSLMAAPSKFVLRDIYTFGSPRIALEDFVYAFEMSMTAHVGYSWRIVAAGDPVPLVPPVIITDPKFIHLDKAFQVSERDAPVGMRSERDTHPRPPIPVVAVNMSNHTPWSYFNALYYAATHPRVVVDA